MATQRVKSAVGALSADQLAALSSQAQKQEVGGTRMPKVTDPAFPMFEPAPGHKYLVYVPEHVYIDDEGKAQLRMDRVVRHTFRKGKTFIHYRSIQGIELEGTPFDGTDPIAEDGIGASFEYAAAKVAHECMIAGLNGEDREDERVKNIRRAAYGNNMEFFQPASLRLTFPIVVIEHTLSEKGRITPALVDGKLAYNVYWYTVGETTFDKTWAKVFESVEEDDILDTIGGGVFEISYGEMDENGKAPEVRDAHKDFKTIYRKALRNALRQEQEGEDGEKFTLASMLDKETEAWTPGKAMEVIIANQLPDPAELRKFVAEQVVEIEQQTNILKSGGALAGGGAAAAPMSLADLQGAGKTEAAAAAPAPVVEGLLPAAATDEG